MKNPIELMNPGVVSIKQQEIFKFNALAKQNGNIINMTIGEPNFATPEHIKLAAIKAILDDDTKYTVPEGDHALLRAASKYLNNKFDLNFDPETEMITSLGVTEGVFSTLNALLTSNDEVLIPAPCYTVYGPDTEFDRATPLYLDTSKTEFKVQPDQLDEILKNHPNIKAFLFTYPNNPTGVSYTKIELEKLANVLRKYDIFVISDEIYGELTYNFKHYSFANLLPEQTILLTGVSKSHAMTGWRIGLICGPKSVISQINKIHELATTSVASISQEAAIEAYTNGYNDSKVMLDEYRKRRDVLLAGLEKIDFYCPIPDGAFYLFAKIPDDLNQDDVFFAKDLLAKEGLAILPGSYFGQGGQGHLRLSYASSMENIQSAIQKLGSYVADQKTAFRQLK